MKSVREFDLWSTSLNICTLFNSSWINVKTLQHHMKSIPLFFTLHCENLPSVFAVVLDSKAIDSNQPMNALMRLNQIRPGLQYRLLSQSGPVHAPVFTMSVDLDGTIYEASGSSKKTAKLHVAVKVLNKITQFVQ